MNPEFADFELPEDVFEAANRAEATSSIELGVEEDADSFFERLKALSEESEAETSEEEKPAAEETEEAEEEEPEEINPGEETIGLRSVELKRFLSDIKKESMLFDPDDPEDQELPTIAFSSMVSDKDKMF